MKHHKIILILAGIMVWPLLITAQLGSSLSQATFVDSYKNVDGVYLKAFVYQPTDHKPTDQRPAIVFFFGGGWKKGHPAQFAKHCEYLASRGMVAISAEYRVAERHGVKASACVSDAKSAIRWVRENAERLGVDPFKIIASGGSAGGHLAASTALLPGHNDPDDNLSITAIPNALILFNPAVLLADIPGEVSLDPEVVKELQRRLGANGRSMSPYHHIRSGIGPTLIFHGTADNTVPFKVIERFDEAMDAAGNDCTLIAYEGKSHGFFNYGRGDDGPFYDTLQQIDGFLVEKGFLKVLPLSSKN